MNARAPRETSAVLGEHPATGAGNDRPRASSGSRAARAPRSSGRRSRRPPLMISVGARPGALHGRGIRFRRSLVLGAGVTIGYGSHVAADACSPGCVASATGRRSRAPRVTVAAARTDQDRRSHGAAARDVLHGRAAGSWAAGFAAPSAHVLNRIPSGRCAAADGMKLTAAKSVEAHGRARDADAVAEPCGESVGDEHAQHFAGARHVAQLRGELVDVEQARVRLQERAEDGALGEVVVGQWARTYANRCSCATLDGAALERRRGALFNGSNPVIQATAAPGSTRSGYDAVVLTPNVSAEALRLYGYPQCRGHCLERHR